MDVARQETETAQKLVDGEFQALEALLTVSPVNPEALSEQLEIIDGELEDYYAHVSTYKELLIKNKNNAEYDIQAANHQAYRKKRIIKKNAVIKASVGLTATAGTTVGDPAAYRVTLPQRELPTFDGDVRKFKAFWASFQVIDGNNTIPNIEKYSYLLQAMKIGSKARKVVEDIPPDNKSYDLAKAELQHRYGRDKTIIKEYVRDLMEMVVDNAKNKRDYNFINMFSSLQSQILNLGQLGVTPDKFGLLLYPIVECCIPPEVLARYLESPGVKEELPELLDFLRNEVRRKEDVERAQVAFGTQKEEKKTRKQLEEPIVPTAVNFMNTATSCAFCNNNHQTADCRKAVNMSLEDRIAVLKKTSSCFKCLGDKHDSKKCKAKILCLICRGNHHALMCYGVRQQARQLTLNGYGQQYVADQPQYLPQQQPTEYRPAVFSQQQVHQPREYYQPPPNQFYRPPQQRLQNSRMDQLNSSSQYQPEGFIPVNNLQTSNTESSQAMFPESSNGTRPDLANYLKKPEVLMQTLLARVYRQDNTFRTVRVLFDSGSQSSYIRAGLVQELELPIEGKEKVCHQVFGGNVSSEMEHDIVRVILSGVFDTHNTRCTFLASVNNRIAQNIIGIPPGPWLNECSHLGIQLSDPVGYSSDIDLLVGNDVSPYMMVGLQSHKLSSGLIAKETMLGWLLEGKIPGTEVKGSNKALICTNLLIAEKDIENYWALEAIGIRDAAVNETRAELEEAAIHHFNSTVTRDETGRYIVHLPWVEGHPSLPDNKAMVFKRLERTTQELMRDGYLQQYDKILRDWENDGIIEKVPANSKPSGIVHYLGHRAVYKAGSTTPVRPVFNASGKTRLTPSLNDCLEKGPNLVELIPSILSRMRKYRFAATADIKKAFLQMVVTETHRDCLRFPWWEDINDRRRIVVYRHCRVVFGVNSSPFLLGATINHLLDQFQSTYPATVDILKNSYYVDNTVVSLPTMEQLVKFKEESVVIMKSAQMDLRGWEFGPSAEDKQVAVLGIIWHTGSDTFSYDLEKILKREVKIVTKRTLLALANSVFDPLGLLSPIVISIRIIFKKVCADDAKFSWDQELPENYSKEAILWWRQLKSLEDLKIPRFIGSILAEKSGWSFHVFCDASKEAYSCMVLLRVEGEPVSVHLVQARARVTPKKTPTIPRGELLGCLIAARLYTQVKEDLDAHEVPVTFWTDSSTALIWITDTSSVWATFVNRRVENIRELTNIEDWRHITGLANPADKPSRGITVKKYLELRWWEGPSFLREPPENFPVSNPLVNPTLVSTERKKTVVSALNAFKQPNYLDCLLRVTDWHKMVRIIAILRRFVIGRKWIINRTSITAADMESAEKVLIVYIQQSPVVNDWKSANLTELDGDGVLRVVTKLTDKCDECNFVKPIVLPGNHPMVRQLIMKEHALASHAGVGYMLSLLRQRFWIINPRRTVKSVIEKCSICRVHFAKRCHVKEAPLPANRITTSYCFQVTGVDLAGPLILKDGQKVWVVLFTCAVYRAIHIEIVTSLSTEAFLVSLRKFVARRGRPRTIYSDNGTNFVGCHNLFKSLDWEKVEDYAAVNRIQWIFNAPTAAWWGGFWERLIGLLKEIVRRSLGKRSVTRDELETVLLEAEAVMNERPLTYVSDDSRNLSPLTPSLFLRDLPANHLPELDVSASNLRKNYRHVQRLREEIRTRFRKEYLAMLVQKRKTRFSDQLTAGDVVLIEIENRKRLEWPMGVIIEVFPGRDGVCRTAMVRTKHGEIVRPYQRLFPLEIRQPDVKMVEEAREVNATEVEKVLEGEQVEFPDKMIHKEKEDSVFVTKYGRAVRQPDKLVYF